MDRKLSTILAADVVGYSALMERDEAGTFERLRAGRKELFEPEIARHHGHIFKLMGDGMLAEFGSVVDAVECAVALQRGLVERNGAVPEDQRIQVRIGINLGEVIVEGEDRYGEGVNVAARLQQLADPGGVCVSGKVAKEVEKKLAFGLEPMGEQKVKNIAEPVQAFRVLLEGQARRRPARSSFPRWGWAAVVVSILVPVLVGLVWQFWPTAAVVGKPSVAVLPFDNYDGDEATGRLADGLTEDVITDLARFPEFQVIARNSTETYKGKSVDVREVGKALDVGFVVEGSIAREADRVRITAQLIDTKTARHLWSQRWDRPDNEVFAIQTEIAEQIANRLGGGAGLIQETGRMAAHRKAPSNLNAYELYLLGTERLEQVDRVNLEAALGLLTRAVKSDPGLARGWIELFHTHSLLASFGVEPERNRNLAQAAAERALALDPSDPEAHAVYGSSLGMRGDFARAEAEYETALRLAPNAAEILIFYIGWTPSFGKPERGAELVERAIRLDPNYPAWANRPFALAYFMAGRYAEAVAMFERLGTARHNLWSWSAHAGALAAAGRREEAAALVARARATHPTLTIESIANEAFWNDAERQRFIDTMRLAGFPACATPEALAKIEKPLRLQECVSR
ncbi:adenylate/guanylate cyclase domain-containing protein [Ensifer aridi]|uniref:adenylate/guanylate cyclase domain-containing protein n=1 Tax=Ensifer aridi TaxID=1708715 RepID=UPI0009BEB042|nr:adenylate/guanylate cyclase domain-containing protein [Ensifer aridi]